MQTCYYQQIRALLNCGHITGLDIIAFGLTLRQCENELRSTLEDWILVGLRPSHPLPIIQNIDRPIDLDEWLAL